MNESERKEKRFDRDTEMPIKIYGDSEQVMGVVTSYYGCPVCNRELQFGYNYCPECGQKIKW